MDHITKRSSLTTLACMLLVFNGIGEHVRADTEPPRVILTPAARDLVVGPGMNAAGRDLRGCQFVTQDLSRAVFDGCNLYGVRIDGCILKGASFRGAVFAGAHVEVNPTDEGADFTDATINGVSRFWQSNGSGFRLYGMDLTPQQLMSTWSYKNKDLRRCAIDASYPYPSTEVASFDLRGADLRDATLQGDLSKCDFTNARIFGATFASESFSAKQLASTWDFRQRRLRVRLSLGGETAAASSGKWDFSRVSLVGSELSSPPPDADFTDATINDSTIRNGLTKAQLYCTRSYQRGDLTGLRLMSSDLSGCDLSRMNLTGCSFEHCNLAGTNFEDSVITGALFLTANYIRRDQSSAEWDGLTSAQIKSTWNYKHGRMEGIRLPEGIAEALRRESE
jgi:uncharacterized protein YjbI with pentapeptide repeats